MNDFEKAKKFITDKNNRLTEISKATGISYPTLSIYRANPEKLKKAAWIYVYKLAKLYEN